MFGYVRVSEGELKINDFTLYRGVYCGLCKTMKKCTGATSCMTLSYDFVFLALLRSALSHLGFSVVPGKCILHPLKKRPMAKRNESLEFCAGVSAVLTYYKLLDDKNDGDSAKKLKIKAALPQAKKNYKKAIKNLPQYKLDVLAQQTEQYLNQLSELESSSTLSPNLCAEPFGKLLGVVFSHCIDDEHTAKTCYTLGYHLGRYIYLIDAIDDFEKDKESGSFNPLRAAGFDELPQDYAVASLANDNMLALKALNELDIEYDDIKNILINVLELGLPEMLNKILKKKAEKEQ